MKYIRFTINMIMLVAACYFGFTIFNAGVFNPVEWYPESQKYFIFIIVGCIITYLVFTGEPPKPKN